MLILIVKFMISLVVYNFLSKVKLVINETILLAKTKACLTKIISPSKKLKDVKAESIGKRFKEKDFARKCSRERMLVCEHIGIPKEKFFEIALEAMQGISEELGL